MVVFVATFHYFGSCRFVSQVKACFINQNESLTKGGKRLKGCSDETEHPDYFSEGMPIISREQPECWQEPEREL